MIIKFIIITEHTIIIIIENINFILIKTKVINKMDIKIRFYYKDEPFILFFIIYGYNYKKN